MYFSSMHILLPKCLCSHSLKHSSNFFLEYDYDYLQYQGCYEDDPEEPDLDRRVTGPTNTERCVARCYDIGTAFASVQFSEVGVLYAKPLNLQPWMDPWILWGMGGSSKSLCVITIFRGYNHCATTKYIQFQEDTYRNNNVQIVGEGRGLETP